MLYIQSLFVRPKRSDRERRRCTSEILKAGLPVFIIVSLIGTTLLALFVNLWFLLLLIVIAVGWPLWYGFVKYHASKYGLLGW